MSLARLRTKLKRHPVLRKSKVWAWVAPGNVPDPIVLAVVSARLQKAELILKLSHRNEKAGRALVRRHAAKGQKVRIAVDYGDFKKLAARADAWVAYGSDATIERLRKAAPKGAGFVGHGHRISFAAVFRSSLRNNPVRAARACARDIHAHDQLGCLSPQIVWVEGNAEPFARMLSDELARAERLRGRAPRDAETQRMRRSLLSELEVRALDPRELRIVRRPGAHPGDPLVYLLLKGRFLSPGGAQVAAVRSFRTPRDVRKGMDAFVRHLQGIGVAGSPAERRRLGRLFSDSSVTYIAPAGRLQTPPLGWELEGIRWNF